MTWRWFEVVGVEIEYAIVDARRLDVVPIAEVLLTEDGRTVDEVEHGDVARSNELARHVIEIKTNGPTARLEGVAARFQAEIDAIHRELAPHSARLLPGGMHPWMDPHAELELWPFAYDAIYRAYDRIFGCGGHGWANLQSTHVNLPFQGDREFRALHAAIRAVLPILPAIAASSPFADGKFSGALDHRMRVYRTNSKRVPSVTGQVVPDTYRSRAEYETMLQGMYRDIAPLDPEGRLQHEWLNSRGAIARFDRGAIEIRVIDAQECPLSDLAIVALVVRTVEALATERWAPIDALEAPDTDELVALLRSSELNAGRAVLDWDAYTALFGLGGGLYAAREVWEHLRAELLPGPTEWDPALDVILSRGSLARRLLEATGDEPDHAKLKGVYGELADCLRWGEPFAP